LKWPKRIEIPSNRFRLFVAADIEGNGNTAVSQFASAALNRGMVYFCSWGIGCGRFHDIVDEIVAMQEPRKDNSAAVSPRDTVMTTWHDNESLEEALNFFIGAALPTEGLILDSTFRLVLCVGHQEWANRAMRVLQSAKFFI
jgi:hypothetical protein